MYLAAIGAGVSAATSVIKSLRGQDAPGTTATQAADRPRAKPAPAGGQSELPSGAAKALSELKSMLLDQQQVAGLGSGGQGGVARGLRAYGASTAKG